MTGAMSWAEILKGRRGRRDFADLTRPVLVLVDLQRLFCEPDSPAYLSGWSEAAPRALELARAFLGAGWPVLATRHGHQPDDEGALIGRFFGRLLASDDPLAGLLPALESLVPAEAVYLKDRHSIFCSAPLVERLRGHDALVLAGVQTPLCVLASALDAPRFGLTPVVAADATAARGDAEHLAALTCLAEGHAQVATVAEILASWTLEGSR